MFNKYMQERELNVKVGDEVSVQGNAGIVTEVIKSIKTNWNGNRYVEIAGTESTSVRVHFSGNLAGTVFQDGVYGGYIVTKQA